jgi:hypothetical protein
MQVILAGVNAALTNLRRWPVVWKSGDIRLLYKKGLPTEITNYRPVVLLSAIYKVITAVIMSRLSAIAERFGFLDDSQEGFRPCRSTARQAQSLFWDREDARRRKQRLIIAYIDFANAFNSIDHGALWAWLRKLGVPASDVDLIQHVYSDSFFQADTTYGKSAPIFLSRGTKQGDGLSPLLFILIFDALLKRIRASGLGYTNGLGQTTAQRAFADDLTLTTMSESDMNKCLELLSQFCKWSGARPHVKKSEITAFDFDKGQTIPTESIKLDGQSLTCVDPNSPSRYLGYRSSIRGSTMGEIRHIFASTAELAVKCKRHPYLYHQAVKAVTMVQEARFRYSAPLTRWSDAQLAHLHTLWVANIKAAMGLSPGTAGCPFTLPVPLGGTPIRQPHVVLMQSLSSHIHQVVQHNDPLRQQAK